MLYLLSQEMSNYLINRFYNKLEYKKEISNLSTESEYLTIYFLFK